MFKGKTPLIIGIVLGILAGIMAMVALKNKEREVTRGWSLQEVVVAAEDVTEGAHLEISMIAKRKIPEQFITKSTIRPKDVEKILGQTVVVNLHEGDPLQWSHFQESHGFERLSNIIPRQGRAISLRLNAESAVGYWVRPNDHVDVIGTFRDPATNQMVSLTLLQNVVVLATGKLTSATNFNVLPENERTYAHATIAVLPEDAEIMVLAQELGSLHFSLRNPEDLSLRAAEKSKATIDTFFSGDRLRQLDNARGAITVIKAGR
jgi:pilus assembly protein CpaB